MASGGQKCEWLVILPDNDGASQKRLEVRPAHIDRVKSEAQDGFWLMGGAMLTDPPAADKPLKACGSAMLASASSREEVLQRLKDDVYTTGGVWDWDKVQIWPFRSAIRTGIEGVS